MAAGYPALCKQGRSSSSVPSFRPFSSSAPRLLSILVLLASLSLLPVGWSSGIVVRSAGTVSGDIGGDGSPQLLAYRPRKTEQGTTGDGAFIFPGGSISLLLFGYHITNQTTVAFTDDSRGSCDPSDVDLIAGGSVSLVEQQLVMDNSSDPTVLQIAMLEVSISLSSSKTFYFCLRGEPNSDYVHQGDSGLVQIRISPPLLPLGAEIFFICILLVLSGLFSGLNLGLMSLDPTTLKIIMESGSKRHKIYAKIIYKVRKRGNYLLCTLLLGNVLVNSALAILLDSVLGSGVYAVVASTIAIVIFGEIIPQAICSRYGLLVGAWTFPLTLVFMVLTFPISLPLSLLLDLILGKEIGSVYDREQLLKLLDVTQEHHDLEKDEVNIISGALAFKKKIAADVMTKIENVYCLSNSGVLDFKTIKEIYESGFSRIPIYNEADKNDIIGILYVRDLAFIDPDDQTPIQAHLDFYKYEVLNFWTDSTLGELLLRFTEGKSHLGIIQRVNSETELDPFYEVVGIVTLEDIVEEILQREIVDETDRFMDNRSWEPHAKRKHFNVADFMEPPSSKTFTLSSQQKLAVYQFLTGIEPFSKQHMSPSILKRLLNQDIVRLLSRDDYTRDDHALYSAGSPASFFTLIVEGCVQVTIGNDGMEFQSRSFSHFGTQALLNTLEDPPADYIPDYTVRPTMDCLVVIITQRQYTAARNATLFFDKDKKVEDDGGDSGEGGAAGEGGSGGPYRTGDRRSVDKADVFKQEWEMAETHDLQNSLTSKSGLTPIARLFKKKSNSKQNAKSDRRGLLTMSSSESEAGSGDSSSSSVQVCVSLEEEEEGNFVTGAGSGGSVELRTKAAVPSIIENYPSSPEHPRSAYQTTQV